LYENWQCDFTRFLFKLERFAANSFDATEWEQEFGLELSLSANEKYLHIVLDIATII
jgi:hypothetical protein